MRWDINKAGVRGHLKLVSARKRIGQAGATVLYARTRAAAAPPPRGDRTRHAAARRRRSESHPFTHYLILDQPTFYSTFHFLSVIFKAYFQAALMLYF